MLELSINIRLIILGKLLFGQKINTDQNKVGRAIRVSADIQQNFSYMEEMWLGSRKYGHSYFWKKIVVVQMKQLLKKLTGNIDDSINFSTIFSYLSKPIGAAFFSIAYILYTSVL